MFNVIVISAYEFICKRPEIPNVSANSPNVQVKGRTIVGTIPKPNYNTQAEGTVVVTVYVDQYGNVTHAKPGAEGSTTSNADLLSAARSAAMKTHFNQDAKAPALQEGTIMYVLKLR